ncbi:putative Fungal specific transcription factor [Taphrina deformans PYCC 5710]|uniref:Fungal specific transcription factor n=1 Tax=Taphrina deformans (strain PYCC 5710 / ATCC 11124 / CBS 356.35 / IMI 108563 / JCM 9778 / NBRC 8474) TaxID=1097556 RepID=R4X6X3_TAPDE|nr:putative Fungal specific transcription factor [Taphrina deformans PYCC 5710]|eukprot:CCG80977.1 putative Fungal specific transcription factor [Taphrina deformans PYCC 5710]
MIFPDKSFIDDSYLRALIDKYFEKISGKTFSFIHEPTTRAFINSKNLPPLAEAHSRASLIFGIAAITIQSTNYENKVEDTEILVRLAKSHIDQDDPSLENLQALLALAIAYLSFGDTRKSFMSVGVCCRMAIALDLLREPPHSMSPLTKEIRRRCFWATYILDRYTAAGSKRFATYDDNSIKVNFPCRDEYWNSANSNAIQHNQTSLANSEVQGFFSSEYNGLQQYLLVVSILGQAIQYHQLGGVEGDTHFPWHQQSRLSKIRTSLQNWASRNMQQLTLGEEQLRKRLTMSDGQVYLMMRAIYHVIHCLLYLNVLPMRLNELEVGPALQQAWRREAVETVLQHSNHIGELAESLLSNFPARQVDSSVPAFFGFCTFVAGIGHVYGSHYIEAPLPHRISPSRSAKHLHNEFDLLKSLRVNWKSAEHQFLILKILRKEHMSVVKNGVQKSIYYNEDILSRYDVLKGVDWSHCSLAPINGQEMYELAGVYESDSETESCSTTNVDTSENGQFVRRTENLSLNRFQAQSSDGTEMPAQEEHETLYRGMHHENVGDYLEFDLLDDEMLMLDPRHTDGQDVQMDVDPFLMSLQAF